MGGVASGFGRKRLGRALMSQQECGGRIESQVKAFKIIRFHGEPDGGNRNLFQLLCELTGFLNKVRFGTDQPAEKGHVWCKSRTVVPVAQVFHNRSESLFRIALRNEP